MEIATTIMGITITTAAIVALLKIIAIDIVLSGDNAIVIAMATRSLPKDLQNKAILWGTAGAVTLRILFAIIIVWLLQIPFVNIIGGLLLLWIAYTVLVGGKDEANISSHTGFMKAIGTIIMADAVMSLDNVIAVAGAANGHILMIAVGVAISIPIMIFGSKFIVKAMDKYHWIAYVGSGILAWTAGEMLLKDKHVDQLLGITEGFMTYLIIVLLTVLILFLGYSTNKRAAYKRRERQQYSQ
ncbi:TerC family protein [Bacillus sp. FJAT-49711]|uniref:TerC family protein n=1 Tax=Bacillus sp. FJAT-49711 TaxID=2833585 RepID=UPI001BCA00EB|nr:TerC family protein [Bacillus sp. FJAT-49711]MBS4220886.1 TerC family protein [Bacillus sp. FJAT-49711]